MLSSVAGVVWVVKNGGVTQHGERKEERGVYNVRIDVLTTTVRIGEYDAYVDNSGEQNAVFF